MRRIGISTVFGFFLTGAVYALHVVVLKNYSWKDKPMMPNFFTYLLLPGYTAAMSIPINHSVQLTIAVILDSLLFGIPVWLLFTLKYHFSRRG